MFSKEDKGMEIFLTDGLPQLQYTHALVLPVPIGVCRLLFCFETSASSACFVRTILLFNKDFSSFRWGNANSLFQLEIAHVHAKSRRQRTLSLKTSYPEIRIRRKGQTEEGDLNDLVTWATEAEEGGYTVQSWIFREGLSQGLRDRKVP